MENGKQKSRWRIIEICIIVAILVFPLIIVLRQVSNYSDNSVVVTIRNASTSPISSVELKHNREVIKIKGIPPGKNEAINFNPQGESSYTLTATFKGEKTVTGGCGYVERGYRTTETVTAKGIESECILPGSNEITALTYWIYGVIAVILWQIVKYFIVLRKRQTAVMDTR